MKKIQNEVIIYFNSNNNTINLIKAPGGELVGAKFYSEIAEGNLFCESVFIKNINSILKEAKLNKENKYNIKLILPDEFFVTQTVNLNNKLSNHFFVKNKLVNFLELNDCYINYNKINSEKKFIIFEVCSIKKWIVNTFKKIKKVYNIKLKSIISESVSENMFFKQVGYFNEEKYILLKYLDHKAELKLFSNNKCQKKLSVNLNSSCENSSTFENICTSLQLVNLYESKKNVFKTTENTTGFFELIKFIKVLQQNKNLKVVVEGKENCKEFISQLKPLDNSINYINSKSLYGIYKNVESIQLIGALFFKERNNVNIYEFEYLNKGLNTILNGCNNAKIYLKYLLKQLKIKNRNIVVKQKTSD